MAKFVLGTFVCALLVAGTQANPTGRIVGGVDATEAQFPHQVSLRRLGSHTCGGSIISRNYVLTAAHCVGIDPREYTIRAGSNDRLQGGVVIQVAAITVHEEYGNFLNDVALLRLAEPLIYSNNIKAITLASNETPAGAPVVISGWGRLRKYGDIPKHLQWNTLSAISRSECKAKINMDSDTLLCLDHPLDNGACNGDSGGPAVYNGEVVGIAGFVVGGCGGYYPDGYAKVYYHRDWIRAHSDL